MIAVFTITLLATTSVKISIKRYVLLRDTYTETVRPTIPRSCSFA